jgi:hypothetical protein
VFCSLKLEAWAVGITVGSRGERPGRIGCDKKRIIIIIIIIIIVVVILGQEKLDTTWKQNAS